MMVSTHLGSLFDVKADVFSLPVDKRLGLDSDVVSRAGATFADNHYRVRENGIWIKSLPLVRPTVINVDKGDVFACKALMLVHDGVKKKDIPSSTELRKVRQAYKCFFDYVEEYNCQSVAITLPSTNSREVLSEILHASISRAPRVGVEKVLLLSESPATLKIVHSLMGTNRLLLGKIAELNATLQSLKIAPPSVFLSAFKKMQRMTAKKQKCPGCHSEFTSLGKLIRHVNMSHSETPREPEVVEQFYTDFYIDNLSHKLEKMARLRDAYNRLSVTSDAFDNACKKIKSAQQIERFCRDIEQLIAKHEVINQIE